MAREWQCASPPLRRRRLPRTSSLLAMGKRKSSAKPPPKKARAKLDEIFSCPFCNAGASLRRVPPLMAPDAALVSPAKLKPNAWRAQRRACTARWTETGTWARSSATSATPTTQSRYTPSRSPSTSTGALPPHAARRSLLEAGGALRASPRLSPAAPT